MQERQAGVTALVTAYARAYHATHVSPKIFDDFLADQFYTAEEHASFDQNLAGLLKLIDPELAASHPDAAEALALVMEIQNGSVTLSRSRYTEDSLATAVREGAQQYIILGAGFDTFAFREPELMEHLHVFEVDHPVTQEMKRQRIASAGWTLPENLHFVPVDFTRSDLVSALRQSAYDPQKMSFISWLGVTYYLPKEAVMKTLSDIAGASQKGSTIVFDYFDLDAFVPEKAGKRMQFMHWIAQQVGEPMKAGFDPLTLASDLDQLGLHLAENLSPADIEARYFQGRRDRYHAMEHVHFAKALIYR